MSANVEIKARVRGDLECLRSRAAELATAPPIPIRQEDTFFWTPRGRLKLRVAVPGSSELIYYERPDEPGPTRSSYFIAPVSDAAAVRRVLEKSLGVRGVVRKKRELFLAGDTRIHLDEVELLGSFLELEVALAEGAEAAAQARCRELMQALGVRDVDLVDQAYIDMLEARGSAI